MKPPIRFTRALDALVKAFFNDHLSRGHCAACAVGNIVAYCNGVDMKNFTQKSDSSVFPHANWVYLGFTFEGTQLPGMNPGGPMGLPVPSKEFDIIIAKRFIFATGYSDSEILKMEFAFETNTKIYGSDYHIHTPKEIMEDQYNGLMAVVDVLCELDDIEAIEYKNRFYFNDHGMPVASTGDDRCHNTLVID